MVGPQVGAGSERDGDARGGLADDESPSGEVPPHRSELMSGVHVRAARLGMYGCQLSRGGGVAERDGGGDGEARSAPGSGGVGGWGPGAEHAGADHRSGADGHSVAQSQASLQRGGHRSRTGRLDRHVGAPVPHPLSERRAGRARRRSRTGPGAGSACLRVLRRCRCGTCARRRGVVRPRRRCRRR